MGVKKKTVKQQDTVTNLKKIHTYTAAVLIKCHNQYVHTHRNTYKAAC